jgi:hypothetical protein
MKNIRVAIKRLVIMTSLFFISCNNNLSLQQFIINQQEKQDVISFDISASLLSATDQLQSKEDIEILKSLKKINVIAYQIKEASQNRYKVEKKHINSILKQDKYQELIRYGKGSQGAKLYLVGEETSLDELIIFANDNKVGWLIIRVLGNDMQPEKIMNILQKIDFDNTDFNISKFKHIFDKN